MKLNNIDINTAAQMIQAKQVSIVDIIEAAYQAIDRHNPQLNALITIRPKTDVLAEAKAKQSKLSSASSPLYGLPYVLKDSYVTKDIQTTAASDVLKGYIPPYSATVYKLLAQSGAILIGKANMDAWGHGGSTENTDAGPTKNPYDPSRVAGGSSGGCAVAISSGMCLFAIGEDTGGSIRNPAAWTNTTGLKVTYGRVSRYGCIAYASSFDTVGPMGKSAQDCAQILTVIAGQDPYDATSAAHPVSNYHHLQVPDQFKIGLPTNLFTEGLDPEMSSIIKKQIDVFRQLGHTIIPLSIPELEYGLAVYYLIAPSETSSNLARYDGVRYGHVRKHFSPETIRRILIGTYALSAGYYDAYYRQAQKVRTLLRKTYDQVFTQVDAIIMPVNPTPPPKIGQLISDPLTNILADVYTTTQNPAGLPALALPAGFTAAGLPVGMQIVSPMFHEQLVLELGHQYQQTTKWHTQTPITEEQTT